MRILVTGASGFIGRQLVPRLQRDGHDVVLLTRQGTARPADARTLAGARDVEVAGAWDGWPDRADALIHLAALNPSRSDPRSRDTAALMLANAEATATLARRAAGHGVGRFVFASTANVHAGGDPTPIREDAPTAPQNSYAASKLEGEIRLRATLGGTNTALTILRLPPVYGTGGRGGIAGLLRLAVSPLPLPFAGLRNRRSVLAAPNAADALALAATRPEGAGETFFAADDEPRSTGDLVALMRAARGRSAMLFPGPLDLLRRTAALAGKGETVERLVGSFVLDDSKIRRRLGWQPPLSTEAALRRMAERDETG